MLALGMMVVIVTLENARADIGMVQRVIGQHHRVTADGVGEMKADPEPFHQTAREVQVALAVLDRVFEFFKVSFAKADIQCRIPQVSVIREQFAQNLDHGLVMEDPLVAPLARQPEPRSQGQIVTMPVLAHARPTGAGDNAAEGPHLVMRLDLDRGFGADQRIKVEVIARGQRLDPVFEQLVKVVCTIETQLNQNIRPKRRRQLALTVGLFEGGVHW